MVNIGPVSGVMATTDVRGAGEGEWAALTGMPATDPLVGAHSPSGLPYDVDGAKSRVVTTGAGSAGDLAARQLDDWRDVMNWRDSPIFWIALMSVLAFGLVSLSFGVKVGK
ncbi:hypothetical protein GKE82_05890 [Conexibacter sp. W3-3-2]|uniref:hypothetical protein n=1 Tax=Conexibacter sp. W3-3-2 TaxID=2675227 RepID=UPI0012BA117F|nr:hypothetical protein [Conexibacter sp. W3-3-2]MTD43847.1 hypothetical protein [Conexibacter sp. W3-3-2]